LICVAMPAILRQGFREGFYDLDKADARFRQRYSRSAEITGFRRAVLESLRHFPLHSLQPELETIAMAGIPSFIVWGEGDKVVPMDVYRSLRAQLPQARGIVLHKARHMPHAERAELFAPTTAEFLKEAHDQRRR
jgi:pimeloyl-ACP methyl ester carboxylesterase